MAGGLLSEELKMSPREKHIKVLLSRSMLDCHQRGIVTVAAALRDAGMEVVYTRFLMPEEVVKTAVEEDVDVIGLSFLAWGAILWYYIWYYLVAGKRYRDLILSHPFYGAQWRQPSDHQ